MFKNIIILIAIILAGIIAWVYLFLFFPEPLTYFRLNNTLTSEQWVNLEDKSLGYKVDYPKSWRGQKQECEEYASSGCLQIWDRGITFITFYVNPSKEAVGSLLKNSLYEHSSRSINGQEYIILSYKDDDASKSERYLISKNGDLIVDSINGYRVDDIAVTQSLADKIIDRIFNSIRKI